MLRRKGENLSPASFSNSAQHGFALLEVLIAILIFTVGILGLIGVQASSIKATVESKNRSDATLIANQVVGDIWTQVGNGTPITNFNGTYSSDLNAGTLWAKNVVAALPNGKIQVDASGPPELKITVSWRDPGTAVGQADHSYEFTTQINVQ